MDYPECINSSNLYTGIGSYASNMCEIVGNKKLLSLVLDKRHNDYPGEILHPRKGSLLNRYVINGMFPKFIYGLENKFYHYLDTGIMPLSEDGIVTVHDLYHPKNESFAIKKVRELKINKFRKFQNVISISETTKKTLIEQGFNKESIEVIHLSAPAGWKKYENVQEIREKFRLPQNVKIALTVGDGYFKNNLLVTKALKNSDFVHVHVGTEAGEIKFNKVSLNDLNQIICASDVLIRVSSEEGFGLPPVQAITLGVPIVVSRTPVFQELFGNSVIYAEIKGESILESVKIAVKEKDEYIEKTSKYASYFGFDAFRKRMDNYYEKIELPL
ncbi:MAG: glycosyltransferase [Candidatus Thermoplasmatota archaeon]|nr:glycosyltransferase [Candidatus Thermoplasmatota archaeon]